jgi:hypothetical protein
MDDSQPLAVAADAASWLFRKASRRSAVGLRDQGTGRRNRGLHQIEALQKDRI